MNSKPESSSGAREVDMSPPAIERRLADVRELNRLARYLSAFRPRLPK